MNFTYQSTTIDHYYLCVLVAGLCDETDPDYELRFDADEEYVRELIDRIDEMSLRGAKL